MELRKTSDQVASLDLGSLLEELRIVVESSLHEQDVQLRWEAGAALPTVWADRQSLMQVFLNLTRNSERAMRNSVLRELRVTAEVHAKGVSIRFRDTGSGVQFPERLFRPFQQQAQATGLGLYLSRAFMRSFRGELRYEPEPDGSSFIVELSRVASERVDSEKDNYGATDTDPAGGRSQSVPGESEPVTRSRA
jgi:C4-dicarboxylate-specific signal transduction histidine kinase